MSTDQPSSSETTTPTGPASPATSKRLDKYDAWITWAVRAVILLAIAWGERSLTGWRKEYRDGQSERQAAAQKLTDAIHDLDKSLAVLTNDVATIKSSVTGLPPAADLVERIDSNTERSRNNEARIGVLEALFDREGDGPAQP